MTNHARTGTPAPQPAPLTNQDHELCDSLLYCSSVAGSYYSRGYLLLLSVAAAR
jgi:hypothetical protein